MLYKFYKNNPLKLKPGIEEMPKISFLMEDPSQTSETNPTQERSFGEQMQYEEEHECGGAYSYTAGRF